MTASRLAVMLGVHRKHVTRLNKLGAIPEPVSIAGNGIPRWRRQEVMAWIAARCPTRDEWRRMGWPPVVVMNLREFIEIQKGELARVREELNESLALLERGQKLVRLIPDDGTMNGSRRRLGA